MVDDIMLSTSSRLTFQRHTVAYGHARRKKTIEIHLIYLGK